MLPRKNTIIMNWYSFLSHEKFFDAILSRLIALDIKEPNILGALLPDTQPGICPRPLAEITATSQALYPL